MEGAQFDVNRPALLAAAQFEVQARRSSGATVTGEGRPRWPFSQVRPTWGWVVAAIVAAAVLVAVLVSEHGHIVPRISEHGNIGGPTPLAERGDIGPTPLAENGSIWPGHDA